MNDTTSKDDHRRLRQEISDPATIRLLQTWEIPSNSGCLEVGAGLGSIAAWIASRVHLTGGRVLATETSETCLDRLTELAYRQPGMEVLRHDVSTDELPPSLDLVHARFVLEHLPEREEVLKRLVRHLAPDGVLLVEDAQIEPNSMAGPTLWKEAFRALVEFRLGLGTDFTWARNLREHAESAGVDKVLHATAETRWFRGGSAEARFWFAVLRGPAKQMFGESFLGGLLALCDEPTRRLAGPRVHRVMTSGGVRRVSTRSCDAADDVASHRGTGP